MSRSRTRGASDRQFGVVWAEPGLTREEVAREELEQALEATLEGLRDFEGIEIARDEIPPDAIDVQVEDSAERLALRPGQRLLPCRSVACSPPSPGSSQSRSSPVAVATADTDPDLDARTGCSTADYDSGQWSKAIATVVKKVKANLKEDLSSSTAPRDPAIVLDIDETAVFNAPCFEQVDWGLSGLATCAVNGEGTVTPVLSLYRYARKKGVRVVMITGRRQALAGVTTQLLKTTRLLLRLPARAQARERHANSVVPYKSAARAVVQRRGFTILANVGDQRSDLAGGHAKRRYKLPKSGRPDHAAGLSPGAQAARRRPWSSFRAVALEVVGPVDHAVARVIVE